MSYFRPMQAWPIGCGFREGVYNKMGDGERRKFVSIASLTPFQVTGAAPVYVVLPKREHYQKTRC